MDKKGAEKETTEDSARESLIAISYAEPDKDPGPALLPRNSKCKKVVEGINGDGDEKYRSKLISLSYTQSPDVGSPGEN